MTTTKGGSVLSQTITTSILSTVVTIPLWVSTNVPSIFLMFFGSIKYVRSPLEIIIIIQI